ncbi:Wzz/FepE/Etk N-terminal domain-containing protein [Segatella bryantii]|jgi:uncharacterized protein involved in exopolysaccharide biosynthesis|uniref:Chain-length determining protein n=1 Tax=Segatella bryantii TaxID=77095 RepID=A0ABX4EKD9_SEGBR|nr:Wzz/FepE/Etk N-terminal domain-containing protein [Segatella bryantii]OYP56307.1 chain-length determining protein [Segatella bryantii]UKK80339.1 Wzz/FepE/Etk N-terminal domain-containing protein [Segatella bryantii]SDM01816.1 Chain length determinant protein [Segatella bryantii]SDZ83278.1 Chain length determinant protein [Segatella bryantii]
MKEYKINIFKLLRIIADDWKKMTITCFTFGIIAIIVAFNIPKIYKASVSLAPETSENSSLSSNIASVASMIGMDMNFGQGNDAIYPEIYPDLMQSTRFIVGLFDIKVQTEDGKITTTFYDYLKTKQKSPFWEELIDYGRNLFKKKTKGNISKKVDPFRLSKEQMDIVNAISSDIDCKVDKKTSIITIEVTTQDPLISACMADSVKARLQLYITNYRTNKAKADVAYMEKLYKQAKENYTKVRKQYAEFSDANEEMLLNSYKSKQEELENEMQLQYNMYTEVARQLQLSKAKLQEKTPAFTVVQNSTVPSKHSNKPKIIILLQFIILGFILRFCFLIYYRRKDIFE